MILSEIQLKNKCKEWQKRLRLQDWNVSVGIYRARNMTLDGCNGECEWNIQKKMAKIRILDPIDYPDDLMEEHDMERTLVHELLHLHFAPLNISNNCSEEIAEEQAIELISRALIELNRENIKQN